MKAPDTYSEIVERKRYAVETSTRVAGDDWWDGSNFERRGRNSWLYRTPRGAFFVVTRSQWQGEPGTSLRPVTQDEAVTFWEACVRDSDRLAFEDAFPGVKVEDA